MLQNQKKLKTKLEILALIDTILNIICLQKPEQIYIKICSGNRIKADAHDEWARDRRPPRKRRARYDEGRYGHRQRSWQPRFSGELTAVSRLNFVKI